MKHRLFLERTTRQNFFLLLIEKCREMKLNKRDLTKEVFCLSSLIYKRNISRGFILRRVGNV